MSVGDPFLLGVNYWPRNKAMFWWTDFDAAEVRDEFAMIRDVGLTHVRYFLLWESFQRAPDWLIDPRTPLRKGERQLGSLNRHGSSKNTIYNVYTEPLAIRAEDLLLRTVCGELRDHPAIWGWSLGNE